MAVYEANVRDLAEYISNTKLCFSPDKVSSTAGYRVNGTGTRYKVNAHRIKCDRIDVVNDCFVDTEGNIVVASYVPAIDYYFVSNELSPSYKSGDTLRYEYSTGSQILQYEIGKELTLKSYDDFNGYMEKLISFIGNKIEKSINEFKNGEWLLDGVVCNIKWQVDKIRK